MGKKYELEWDHIFPYSVLRDNGYNINNSIKYRYAQEITNRAILTATANAAIGSNARFIPLSYVCLAEASIRLPSSSMALIHRGNGWNLIRSGAL